MLPDVLRHLLALIRTVLYEFNNEKEPLIYRTYRKHYQTKLCASKQTNLLVKQYPKLQTRFGLLGLVSAMQVLSPELESLLEGKMENKWMAFQYRQRKQRKNSQKHQNTAIR